MADATGNEFAGLRKETAFGMTSCSSNVGKLFLQLEQWAKALRFHDCLAFSRF